MKRKLIFILVIFLGSVFISAERVVFTISGNYFSISDADYKERYGETKYFPEGKISLRISGNFYLWGSCGFFSSSYSWEEWSNKGVIYADIKGENVLDKLIISGGLGYYVGFLRQNDISIKVEVGACRITNTIGITKNMIPTKEIVSVEEKEEAGTGIRGNLGVTYGIYKNNLFAELAAGYLYATDKVDDERIKLGGFQVTLGLGLAF
ncbi:MAG: hypothetical protein JSV88_16595 [Candidatus Aminicenantes bacterium]|nr:MAG: hypothetical protein JSV88_16595 [Candidatus Aminicenantes bacterium]